MRVRSWIVVRERLSSCCTLYIVDLMLRSNSVAGMPVHCLFKDSAGPHTSVWCMEDMGLRWWQGLMWWSGYRHRCVLLSYMLSVLCRPFLRSRWNVKFVSLMPFCETCSEGRRVSTRQCMSCPQGRSSGTSYPCACAQSICSRHILNRNG